MNRRQRKLVTRWIVLASVIAGMIVLESFFKGSPWIFRGVLHFGLFVAPIFEIWASEIGSLSVEHRMMPTNSERRAE